MGKPTGFLEFKRQLPSRRAPEERVKDWLEIYQEFPEDALQQQGARCMECGVPFCHTGCPVNNHIPDWNDLVYRGRWEEAVSRAVRGRLRARHQPAAGDHQADRKNDR
jgi:glutamate synthase (NADPH/NADH) small chain